QTITAIRRRFAGDSAGIEAALTWIHENPVHHPVQVVTLRHNGGVQSLQLGIREDIIVVLIHQMLSIPGIGDRTLTDRHGEIAAYNPIKVVRGMLRDLNRLTSARRTTSIVTFRRILLVVKSNYSLRDDRHRMGGSVSKVRTLLRILRPGLAIPGT